MEKSKLCDRCGLRLPARLETINISQLDFYALKDFFDGKFDKSSFCGRSNCPEEKPILIIVSSLEPLTYFVYTNLLIPPVEREKIFSNFLDSYKKDNPDLNLPAGVLKTYDVLDEMREDIGRFWAPIVTYSANYYTQFSQKPDKILEFSRKAFPGMFAVAALSSTHPLDGKRLTPHRADGTEDLELAMQLVAEMQAKIWWGIAMSHFVDNSEIPTLEEDLQKFVDFCPPLPGAFKYLENHIKRLRENLSNESPWTAYCIEALRVSVAKHLTKKDDFKSTWSFRYVVSEMTIRKSDSAPSWQVSAKRVSVERARRTISLTDLKETVISIVNLAGINPNTEELGTDKYSSIPKNWLELVLNIADDLGYGAEVARLVEPQMVFLNLSEEPLRQYTEVFRILLETSGYEVTRVAAAMLFNTLIRSKREKELPELVLALVDQVIQHPDSRGRILVEYGIISKKARRPVEYLDIIGDFPSDWEVNMSGGVKAALEIERSNSLRLIRRVEEALIALDRADKYDDQLSKFDINVKRQNRAILLREKGELEAAVVQLRAMFIDEDAIQNRVGIGQSLATTLLWVGNFSEAVQVAESTLDELSSRSPDANWEPLIGAQLIGLVLSDQKDKAIDLVRRIDLSAASDVLKLAITSAILMLEGHWQNKDKEEYAQITKQSVFMLEELRQKAIDSGDKMNQVGAYRLIGLLAEMQEDESRFKEAYMGLAQLAKDDESAFAPIDLMVVSKFAYNFGNLEFARKLLASVPLALAQKVGAGQDLGVLANSTYEISSPLKDILDILLTHSHAPEDYRLVSELQRESATRAIAIRTDGKKWSQFLSEGLHDKMIGKISSPDRPVAVVEWSEASRGFLTSVTVIGVGGEEVEFNWLDAPSLDPVEVSRRLIPRIKNWTSRTEGDPLEFNEWRVLADWLRNELHKYVPSGSHIIIIENSYFSSLPWHSALIADWTCSYAPSWTDLLDLENTTVKYKKVSSIGSITIPRYKEGDTVLNAYSISDERLRSIVAKYQPIEHIHLEGNEANIDSVMNVLEHVDLVRILCHGFVDSFENEVAYLIAAEGSLPPTDSISANSLGGKKHRLSWREIQKSDEMPEVVFTTACSSGISHFVGVGDRLGLYRAIRWGGARLMVSPRWDVIAKDVIPILDNVIERLFNGEAVAEAIRNSTIEANNTQKDWIATSLAIEGDWKWKISM